MVQFVNGSSNKSGYRKFIIKTVVGQDDFSSMKETVLRRYSRLKKEGLSMPDLIVIDGGPGQLHSATSALMELGLEIPICSLAKKEEEIFLPNKMHSIRLPKSNIGLKLLQQGRDEAHRFAITFHKKRRKKATFDK
jgi:excinuclease ABC subunit C